MSGLSSFVAPELFSGVDCDVCGARRPTLHGNALPALPGVLVLAANRFVFDMTVMDNVKLKDRFEYPLVLDMRPFLPDGALSRAQTTLGQARADVQAACESVGIDPDVALAADSDDVLPEVVRPALVAARAATRALEEAEARARDSCVWLSALDSEAGRSASRELAASFDALPDDERAHVYDLFAVVIHHGATTQHGHYTAFIRDLLREGTWTAKVRDSSARVAARMHHKGGCVLLAGRSRSHGWKGAWCTIPPIGRRKHQVPQEG